MLAFLWDTHHRKHSTCSRLWWCYWTPVTLARGSIRSCSDQEPVHLGHKKVFWLKWRLLVHLSFISNIKVTHNSWNSSRYKFTSVARKLLLPQGQISLSFEEGKQSHFLYFLNAITSSYIKAVCVNSTELLDSLFFSFYSGEKQLYPWWGGWSPAPVFQSFTSPGQSSTQKSLHPHACAEKCLQ